MKILKNITFCKIRFSEVDAMKVVWHGNYVKYLEDGREAFGKEYALGYSDVYAKNVMTPIVKLEMNFKNYLHHNEQIRVETEFKNTQAAKIIFDYKIFRCSDNKEVLQAQSIQVFTDITGELLLTNPPFYEVWKKKWGLVI